MIDWLNDSLTHSLTCFCVLFRWVYLCWQRLSLSCIASRVPFCLVWERRLRRKRCLRRSRIRWVALGTYIWFPRLNNYNRLCLPSHSSTILSQTMTYPTPCWMGPRPLLTSTTRRQKSLQGMAPFPSQLCHSTLHHHPTFGLRPGATMTTKSRWWASMGKWGRRESQRAVYIVSGLGIVWRTETAWLERKLTRGAMYGEAGVWDSNYWKWELFYCIFLCCLF